MRMISKVAVVIGIGTAVVALGVPVAGAGNVGTTTAPVPVTGGTVILTNSSSGTTVTATVGETVEVVLTAGPLRWTEPQVVNAGSTAAAVLTLVSGGTSANGSATATFKVARSGSATIDATGTPICATASVCPTYVLLWHAGVSVPVVDPPVA